MEAIIDGNEQAELEERRSVSEAAERAMQREYELVELEKNKSLSHEEDIELDSLIRKRNERRVSLVNSGKLLLYEEFTEDNRGIPLCDNFIKLLGYPWIKNTPPEELITRFHEQNPELFDRVVDSLGKANKEG